MSISEIITGGIITGAVSLAAFLLGVREKRAVARKVEAEVDASLLDIDIREKEYDQKRYEIMFRRMIEAEKQRDDHEQKIQEMSREIVKMRLLIETLQSQITILKTTK